MNTGTLRWYELFYDLYLFLLFQFIIHDPFDTGLSPTSVDFLKKKVIESDKLIKAKAFRFQLQLHTIRQFINSRFTSFVELTIHNNASHC